MHGRSRTPSEPSSSTSREYRPEGYSEHDKLPIVYSSAYNISFYGLEKVHPFDAGKWGKVFDGLKRESQYQKVAAVAVRSCCGQRVAMMQVGRINGSV